MRIKINLKIFIFIAIFLITGQIKIYGILMFFAFIHELGHLIAGIVMKFKPNSLKIMPMGISINFDILPQEYNTKVLNGNLLKLKKIFIAIAGPLVNIIIIFIMLLINGKIDEQTRILCIYSNFLIAIFNLIPIYPLDGGRILKGIISLRLGHLESIKITNEISNICIIVLTAISSIAIYYYKNIAILFIITYLWTLIIIQNKRYNIKMNIYKFLEKEKDIENKIKK